MRHDVPAGANVFMGQSGLAPLHDSLHPMIRGQLSLQATQIGDKLGRVFKF